MEEGINMDTIAKKFQDYIIETTDIENKKSKLQELDGLCELLRDNKSHMDELFKEINNFYLNRKEKKYNCSKIADCFKILVDKEYIKAMNNYANMLKRGEGISKNKLEAVKYYKIAADNGSLNASYNYAMMLYKGDGIEKDLEKAYEYFKYAANKGHIKAMYEYAFMLENGEGIPVNKSEAIKYYKMAADKGHIEATISYANLKLDDDTEESIIEASRYYHIYYNSVKNKGKKNKNKKQWEIIKNFRNKIMINLQIDKKITEFITNCLFGNKNLIEKSIGKISNLDEKIVKMVFKLVCNCDNNEDIVEFLIKNKKTRKILIKGDFLEEYCKEGATYKNIIDRTLEELQNQKISIETINKIDNELNGLLKSSRKNLSKSLKTITKIIKEDNDKCNEEDTFENITEKYIEKLEKLDLISEQIQNKKIYKSTLDNEYKNALSSNKTISDITINTIFSLATTNNINLIENNDICNITLPSIENVIGNGFGGTANFYKDKIVIKFDNNGMLMNCLEEDMKNLFNSPLIIDKNSLDNNKITELNNTIVLFKTNPAIAFAKLQEFNLKISLGNQEIDDDYKQQLTDAFSTATKTRKQIVKLHRLKQEKSKFLSSENKEIIDIMVDTVIEGLRKDGDFRKNLLENTDIDDINILAKITKSIVKKLERNDDKAVKNIKEQYKKYKNIVNDNSTLFSMLINTAMTNDYDMIDKGIINGTEEEVLSYEW